MRTLIAILATLLLAAPAASAGAVNANATLLEEGGECREWSNYEHGSWEGNNSSGWWYATERGDACHGETTFAEAEASDNEGSLARIAIESWDHESSSRRQEETSYEYDEGGWRGRSHSFTSAAESQRGWGHAATVETTAGSAEAGRECASENTYEDQDSWSNYRSEYGSSSSRQWSGSDTYADGCRAGVTATHAGRDADAHAVNGCTAESSGRGSQGEWSGDYRDYTYTHDGEDACRHGVETGAGGESGFVGLTNGCRWHGDGWGYATGDDEEHNSAGWSECTRGVTVDAPAGPHAWTGLEFTSHENCHSWNGNETCESSETSRVALKADWDRSPVGPVHGDYTILYLP